MFYVLELEEECAEILDKFPWLTSDIDASGAKNKTNTIQMGTKVLGKGHKSKPSTTASQSNCSSISPLNPIRENREIVDMEEQMPVHDPVSHNCAVSMSYTLYYFTT